MKHIKQFEIKSIKLDIPRDEGHDLYFVICEFLEEIKPEIRYIVIKNYPLHLSEARGLAFSFGYSVLFSLKIIKRAAHDAYIIEINNCHQYSGSKSKENIEISESIINFIFTILEKYSIDIDDGGCIKIFKIPELKIKAIIKDLKKENFELYKSAKKYNL